VSCSAATLSLGWISGSAQVQLLTDGRIPVELRAVAWQTRTEAELHIDSASIIGDWIERP